MNYENDILLVENIFKYFKELIPEFPPCTFIISNEPNDMFCVNYDEGILYNKIKFKKLYQ